MRVAAVILCLAIAGCGELAAHVQHVAAGVAELTPTIRDPFRSTMTFTPGRARERD